MSVRSNIKIVQALYQAFGAGDVTAILNLLADDVVFELPRLEGVPLKPRYKGKKGFQQFLKDRGPAIHYDKFAPNEFIGQGEVVVVLGETRGKVLTTGKRFRHQWAQVYRIRYGKIAAIQEFLNTAEIRMAFRADV
jgi:uncharacterized protein